MKRSIPLFAFLVLLLLMTTVRAQTTGFSIDTWLIGNGGGQSSSNSYTLNGAIGQPNAHEPAKGTTHQITGGFWAAANNPRGVSTPDASANLYLPLVAKQQPTPTATTPPPKAWQRLGNGGLDIVTAATQGDQLFAGDRRNFTENGGLYRRSLAGCDAGPTWTRIGAIGFSVRSIVFHGSQGVVAAFTESGMFYSGDGGNQWAKTTSPLGKPRTVTVSGNNVFFAGTEENGIYSSNDNGVTWTQANKEPLQINALQIDRLDATLLWIGANAGVWSFNTVNGRFVENKAGLTGKALEIWGFAVDAANIYIATSDGVYKGKGTDTWQPFGRQGSQINSLEIVDNYLYAGAKPASAGAIGGVWRTPLDGANWTAVTSSGWNETNTVRDLLYEPTYCKGLLAATDDGIWVYR